MRRIYPTEFINSVFSDFFPFEKITSTQLFTSGFENSNYLIVTHAGKYVLKIFEGENLNKTNVLEEISAILHLMNYCKIPKLFLSNSGEYYSDKEGKISILMNYIPGENMNKKKLTVNLARQLGEETGKMDILLKSFKGSKQNMRRSYEFDLKNFTLLKDKVSLLPNDFNKVLFSKIFQNFNEIKPIFDNCDTGFIHNDIVLHNILVENDELVGIIDFSDMAYSPFIQNIATTLAQCFFCYNWNPKQAKIFLEAYNVNRKIPEQEYQILNSLIACRLAVIILEFNAWNIRDGIELEREESVKDYYAFLEKFQTIPQDLFY